MTPGPRDRPGATSRYDSGMFIAQVPRRAFLADLGRGAGALVVLSTLGCAPGGADPGASGSPSSSASAGPVTTPGGPPPKLEWRRVNVGIVSAYVLFRGGEAAIVDTGVAGSADDIEAALTAVDLGWDAVGHVVLTHRHGDHIGSVDDVLARAAGAAGYAGTAELSSISAPRVLVAVGDGDDIFGLQVVDTPGHTAGHISVLDPVAGVLVAGDALNIVDGQVAGANPRFSTDMAAANASVAKLAAFQFETLLVGHGDPIESGASALVAALAAAG